MTDKQVLKKELRKKILQKRAELTEQQVFAYSEAICRKILENPIYQQSNNLCLYMPIRNEVDVTLLVNPARESGKCVWLPKIIDGQMDFYLYGADTVLSESAYHIPEPLSEHRLIPDSSTLVIMPGAVFSVTHDRIGYGGGYYDRYLSKYPTCKTLAVCYDFQVVPELPGEEHDIKPDHIIYN